MSTRYPSDKHSQQNAQKTLNNYLKPNPVDHKNNFNHNLDVTSDLDDICTSISQVPVNPLYRENLPISGKITLPNTNLLLDDRFWQGQANGDTNDKLIQMEDSEFSMISSTSIDTYTPNKTTKDKKTESIWRWSVGVESDNFVIIGQCSKGSSLEKIYSRRISPYIFYDNEGTVCSLHGPSDLARDLPNYIREKFKLGIPFDWYQTFRIWKHYIDSERPPKYKWPSLLERRLSTSIQYQIDSENSELESHISSKTAQQLLKKIQKLKTRLRTMALRESWMSKESTTNINHSNNSINEFVSTNKNSRVLKFDQKPNAKTSSSNSDLLLENSSVSESNSLHLRVNSDETDIKLQMKETKKKSGESDIFPGAGKFKNATIAGKQTEKDISGSPSFMSINFSDLSKISSIKEDVQQNCINYKINMENNNIIHSKLNNFEGFLKPPDIRTLKKRDTKSTSRTNNLSFESNINNDLETNIHLVGNNNYILPIINASKLGENVTSPETSEIYAKKLRKTKKLQSETSYSDSPIVKLNKNNEINVDEQIFSFKRLTRSTSKYIAETSNKESMENTSNLEDQLISPKTQNVILKQSKNNSKQEKSQMEASITASTENNADRKLSSKKRIRHLNRSAPGNNKTKISTTELSKTVPYEIEIFLKSFELKAKKEGLKPNSNTLQIENNMDMLKMNHLIIDSQQDMKEKSSKSSKKRGRQLDLKNNHPNLQPPKTRNRSKNNHKDDTTTQSNSELLPVSFNSVKLSPEKNLKIRNSSKNKSTTQSDSESSPDSFEFVKPTPQKVSKTRNTSKNSQKNDSITQSNLESLPVSFQFAKPSPQKTNTRHASKNNQYKSTSPSHQESLSTSSKFLKRSPEKITKTRNTSKNNHESNSTTQSNSALDSVEFVKPSPQKAPKTRSRSKNNQNNDTTSKSTLESASTLSKSSRGRKNVGKHQGNDTTSQSNPEPSTVSHEFVQPSSENSKTLGQRKKIEISVDTAHSCFTDSFSQTNISTQTSLSSRGRRRVQTLPFWQGARLVTYHEKTVLANNFEKLDVDLCDTNNSTISQSDTINNSNADSILTYDEAFHDFRKPKNPLKMQLMSTFRDSITNSVIKKPTDINISPIVRRKSPIKRIPKKYTDNNNIEHNDKKINKEKTKIVKKKIIERKISLKKEYEFLGPKQTTPFKVPKPKKIKKIKLPTNITELSSFFKKKKQKKEAEKVKQQTVPIIKKRKMFKSDDWLQSEECSKLIEQNEISPKFVLKFNSGTDAEDDKFSEVSAFI